MYVIRTVDELFRNIDYEHKMFIKIASERQGLVEEHDAVPVRMIFFLHFSRFGCCFYEI